MNLNKTAGTDADRRNPRRSGGSVVPYGEPDQNTANIGGLWGTLDWGQRRTVNNVKMTSGSLLGTQDPEQRHGLRHARRRFGGAIRVARQAYGQRGTTTPRKAGGVRLPGVVVAGSYCPNFLAAEDTEMCNGFVLLFKCRRYSAVQRAEPPLRMVFAYRRRRYPSH